MAKASLGLCPISPAGKPAPYRIGSIPGTGGGSLVTQGSRELGVGVARRHHSTHSGKNRIEVPTQTVGDSA